MVVALNKSFQELKQEVNEIMTGSANMARSLEYESYAEEITQLRSHLNNGRFYLAVVGDFSRGKSTFINAFIGGRVLPAKMRPSTAFINRIYNGLEEGVVLETQGGKEDHNQNLTLEEFRKLVAPMTVDEDSSEEEVNAFQENLEKLQHIDCAHISYPMSERLNQVEIYDTPGMNEIYEQREQITKGFIPQADAIIFVLSATANLSYSEVEFLNQQILSEHIRKLFFVINFKDRLHPEDEDRLIDNIHHQLSEAASLPEIHIYLVSSLEALHLKREENGEKVKAASRKYSTLEETGFHELEAQLRHFFDYEQGRVKVDKPARKYIEVTSYFINDRLDVRIQSLDADKDKLEKEIEQVQKNLNQLVQVNKEEVEDLYHRLHHSVHYIEQKSDSLFRKLKNKFEDEVDLYNGSTSNEAVKQYVDSIANELKKDQEAMNQSVSDYMKEVLQQEMEYSIANIEAKELNHSTDYIIGLHMDLNVSLPERVNQEVNGDLFTEGLLTGGVLLGTAIIATPLALMAGVAGIFARHALMDIVTDHIRDKKLNKVKEAYIQEWDAEYQKQKQQINQTWIDILSQTVRSFDRHVHQTIMEHKEHVEIIRRDNMMNQENIEKQKQDIQHVKEQLQYYVEAMKAYTM